MADFYERSGRRSTYPEGAKDRKWLGGSWVHEVEDSPILHAARVAAAAITAALDTERRAANEVEARGGDRSARMTLEADRRAAWRSVLDLAHVAPPGVALELAEMAEAARLGYARPAWALRVVQIAREVQRGK